MTSAAIHLPLWADILATALLLVGAAFALLGSWALAFWSDFYKRLHGPSKASTLGVGCLLLASALCAALQGAASGHELWVALFLAVTAPVSAQLLMQAALRLDPAQRPPLPHATPAAETESPPPPGSGSAAAPG